MVLKSNDVLFNAVGYALEQALDSICICVEDSCTDEERLADLQALAREYTLLSPFATIKRWDHTVERIHKILTATKLEEVF